MVDIVARFRAVGDDYVTASDRLLRVVSYIPSSTLEPELRVLILNNVIVSLTSTLEETIRELFSTYLSILEECVAVPRALRSELLTANLNGAIQQLNAARQVFERPVSSGKVELPIRDTS